VSKSKWPINLFLSLLFMKFKFERHLLYFTSLTITWSLIIKRRFHGCMAIGKHLISLKKYNYCTINVLLNKGAINICFGPIFFSKWYWLISSWCWLHTYQIYAQWTIVFCQNSFDKIRYWNYVHVLTFEFFKKDVFLKFTQLRFFQITFKVLQNDNCKLTIGRTWFL
jgi:hypothetical protein